MPSTVVHRIPSPVGELTLASDGAALQALYFDVPGRPPPLDPALPEGRDAVIEATEAQLGEYFAGARTAFDLPFAPVGSTFQLAVWAELQQIPYGETISYGELAHRLARPTGARAVGLANGRNPISIVVPCHRVIGASGQLTGYGGGLERKAFLLGLEGAGDRALFATA